MQTENWAEALELVGPDPRRPSYYVAAANAESDPKRAMRFSKQAWKQDPAFAPAAIAYAGRLRSAGYEKRAQAIIADDDARSVNGGNCRKRPPYCRKPQRCTAGSADAHFQ